VKSTNFDRYLAEQMSDPAFAARFAQAGDAWDVALQIAALRQRAGLSQKELARRLGTSQQQVSRLESPGYEGHSLGTLRRIASALNAHVRVVFEPSSEPRAARSADTPAVVVKRARAKHARAKSRTR
jgi:transcriptional regulator with XRE-family HTH domain